MNSPKNLILNSTLIQVRTGGIGLVAQSGIKSGIGKSACLGPVRIHRNGVEGDRQAESFHGGGDRAILQYAPANYDDWIRDLPNSAELLQIGSFGENLVATDMSERNVCVGDIMQIGTALLQVAQFRQPCFKLNHQFADNNMSRLTQKTGRTGWFYRVLGEGIVEAGDVITIIDRPQPEWTISRLQHYVYDASDDLDMAQVLANLPHLGEEIRGVFQKRIANNRVENWNLRLSNGPVVERQIKWQELRITKADLVTQSVKLFRLEHPDGKSLEGYEPGAHVDVKACNAYTRSYSLIHLPDGKGYEFAVRLDPGGRGGSMWMHDEAKVNDLIMVSAPRNFFPLAEQATRHKLIAGGIGVTPLLAMIEQLEKTDADWEMRYCATQRENAPFSDELLEKYAENVRLHLDGENTANQLDVAIYLKNQTMGEHVYCCGPTGLMDAVKNASSHWTSGSVHFELFSGPPEVEKEKNTEFTAEIASTGQKITVSPDVTLLEALRVNGIELLSECEAGSCGTCRVGLVSGDVDHRDMVLSPHEKAKSLMCCVSRGKNAIVLDL